MSVSKQLKCQGLPLGRGVCPPLRSVQPRVLLHFSGIAYSTLRRSGGSYEIRSTE